MSDRPNQHHETSVIEREAAPESGRGCLFIQLCVYTGCRDTTPIVSALERLETESVLYADANDPLGIAVLIIQDDEDFLVGPLRETLARTPFSDLTRRPELTMLGRSYLLGHEKTPEETLFRQPRRRLLESDCAWACWYPLRRRGSYEILDPESRRWIQGEHIQMARRAGEAGKVVDVRLACHGLNTRDDDFIVGLLGPQLQWLSRLVQEMRSSRQTAEHLEHMGPFFVGRTIWRTGPRWADSA